MDGRRRGSSFGLPVCHYVHVEYGNQCYRWCANIVRVHHAIVTGLIYVARLGPVWTIMIMHNVNMAKICRRMSMKLYLRKPGCDHGE